ncbi:MAG: hypothetical protein KF691_06675 [Phycisphaeraceae bacterium]|nr:hypothetical protein [Phycisphaeraceae bacterium]
MLPPFYLPLGSCWDDETLLLELRPGLFFGRVSLKTYETLHETGVDRAEDDIFPVAPSFGVFLSMLTDPQEGDEQ